MNFKRCQLIIVLMVCCLLLFGCSSNSKETTEPNLEEIYQDLEQISKELEDIAKQLPKNNEDVSDETEEEVAVETESTSDYLSGEWADKAFKRNGCTSYPFVLDTPLEKCKGFTVDYLVSDVTDGNMKSDSKFQIFYKTIDGTWVKGKTFTLDDGFASVEQTINKAVTVTQVTVLCLNSGNFSWNAAIGIKNPVY